MRRTRSLLVSLGFVVAAARGGVAQVPTPRVPPPSVPTLPALAKTPTPSISGPVSKLPQLSARGEPAVTNWSPKKFVVQGGEIVFTGDLASDDFHAEAGQPPVGLPIVAHGALPGGGTSIHVKVPDTLVSSGAPLVVFYGINGPRKTLTPSLKILKKPRVATFRVTDGPFVMPSRNRGRQTKIEVELADFDASADTFFRPSIWAEGCHTSGLGPDREPGGSPYRITYTQFFDAGDSGKRCTMKIWIYRSGDENKTFAGYVQVPPLETYTIADSWDLLDFTTPSGKKLSASASKGGIPCQLGSVGTAGTFATGVVKEGGDLTFQLRNGLIDEACAFTTNPALLVRDEWAVKSVTWDFTEDSLCAAVNKFATQASSGSTVTSFFDESAVFAVKFEALCKPNGNDLPKNSHVFKARLSSVKVIGPAGKSWRDAFK